MAKNKTSDHTASAPPPKKKTRVDLPKDCNANVLLDVLDSVNCKTKVVENN